MALPATFGKYFLTDKLATGGMAEVYLGKLFGPGGFEKQLVIKQIHPKLADHDRFIDMFVTEAKTTVALTHSNIVAIYELGVVDTTYFIAMEYVDGVTLSQLMRAARKAGRTASPELAAYILAEVLKGLDYAHRKEGHVIHRDLSSRNVMVSRDGEVKILDFGLSVTLETATQATALSSQGGLPVGSFPYLSPEQVSRAPVDPRSDLFSCGILLWELVSGQALFGNNNDDDTLDAVVSKVILPPSSMAGRAPSALDEACLRALERDPQKRWQSASMFLAALSRYLYTHDPIPSAQGLAKLVAEFCPDVPYHSASTRSPSSKKPGSNGAHTRPMTAKPHVEKTFATHVALEEILERTQTPTPAPASSEAGLPATSRLAIAFGVVVFGVLSFALLRDAGQRNTVTASVDAVKFSPMDAPPLAAPLDAPPQDAGKPTQPRVARGTLRIGSDVPATIWLDGRMVGSVPYTAEVSAGRHMLRLVCPASYCPPSGQTETFTANVPTGGTQKVQKNFIE